MKVIGDCEVDPAMQYERLVVAFESLAGSMQSIAKTLEMDYSRKYPARRQNVEATVVEVKTDVDRQREDISGEDASEPLDKWLTLGPREQAFERTEKARREDGQGQGGGTGGGAVAGS